MTIEIVGGRQTHFGPRESNGKYGTKSAGDSQVCSLEYDFSYDDLPADEDGNLMVQGIPAGSVIVDSTLRVGTAWAGGTSIDIGLAQRDGTVIDADGLDAAILTAALTADAVIVGDGALVGATIGGNDAVVEVSATGSYTAGTAKLVVRYLPVGADAA